MTTFRSPISCDSLESPVPWSWSFERRESDMEAWADHPDRYDHYCESVYSDFQMTNLLEIIPRRISEPGYLWIAARSDLHGCGWETWSLQHHWINCFQSLTQSSNSRRDAASFPLWKCSKRTSSSSGNLLEQEGLFFPQSVLHGRTSAPKKISRVKVF